MVAKLGGVKAVRAALPTSDIRELKNGVLIRSARLPPIGDANRHSPTSMSTRCGPTIASHTRSTNRFGLAQGNLRRDHCGPVSNHAPKDWDQR